MKLVSLIIIGLMFSSCMSEGQLKKKMAKILKENPEVLTDAVETNPAKFLLALQSAAGKAKEKLAKERVEREKKDLEKLYDSPLKVEIGKNRAVLGPRNAPIVLVEYSDFQCPYCARGYQTVTELRKKYGNKIQFIYKHLPLSFHAQAKITAQYFEAIAIQSTEKAYKFHDLVFKDISKLKKGEKFLRKIARRAGADIGKINRDKNSKRVMSIIEKDQKEAAKFGIQGTPGFIINGIPVKGAYPASHFVGIIEKLIEKKKLKL